MSISGMASPCVVCHIPCDTMKRETLRRLEELCHDATDDRHGIRCSFLWGLHSRCRYGLTCTKLQQFDSECRLTAGRIERKIVDAVFRSDVTYFKMYKLCRGYFPQVCDELERIRAELKKD